MEELNMKNVKGKIDTVINKMVLLKEIEDELKIGTGIGKSILIFTSDGIKKYADVLGVDTISRTVKADATEISFLYRGIRFHHYE